MAQPLAINTAAHEDGQQASQRRVRRKLNVLLLIGTVVAMVILAPAAYFWHAYQAHRTAEASLDRADALDAEGDALGAEGDALDAEGKWRAAAEYVHRYLRLNPDDEAACIALAETYDKSAKNVREKLQSINLHYRAVGVASSSEQPELRGRLAELLLEMRRFASAEAEAKKILLLLK